MFQRRPPDSHRAIARLAASSGAMWKITRWWREPVAGGGDGDAERPQRRGAGTARGTVDAWPMSGPASSASSTIDYSRWNNRFFWALIGLGPRFSEVVVDDTDLRVRMGWAFHAAVPRADIRRVVAATERPFFAWGVHGWRGRWLVNGSSDGIVACRDRSAGESVDARLPAPPEDRLHQSCRSRRLHHRAAWRLGALVVGGFLGDRHVVGMALLAAGRGDPHEAGVGAQLLEVGGAGVAHARPQARRRVGTRSR